MRHPDGKRLSGAAQRRRARGKVLDETLALSEPLLPARPLVAPESSPEQQSDDPADPSGETPFPPLEEGPEGVEAWGATLAARTLLKAEQGSDHRRVRWLANALRKLGQAMTTGKRSYKATRILREIKGVQIDLMSREPPSEPQAMAAWALLRMARIIYEAATDRRRFDDGAEAYWSMVLEAARTVCYLPQTGRIQQLVAELKASGRKRS